MHAVQRRAFRLLPQLSSQARCRVVTERRFPLGHRAFHRSAVVNTVPDGHSNKTDPVLTQEVDEGSPVPSQEPIGGVDVAENDETLGAISSERLQRPKERQGNYGSGARRTARNKRPREIPPVELPSWFSRNSVRLKEEPWTQTDPLRLYKESTNKQLDSEINLSPARYNLHEDIWKEILSTIRTGLTLPNPSFADDFPAAKAHVLLQCPKDGGVFFLDSIVEKVASALNADLVRLDAQDLAEIGGDYIGEGSYPSPHSIRSLSYDAQLVAARQNAREMGEAEEDEEFEEEEDDDISPSRAASSHFQLSTMPKFSAIPIGTFSGNLEDLLKAGKLLTGNQSSNGTRLNGPPPQYSRPVWPPSEQWNDMKLGMLLEAFMDAGLEKRKILKQGDELNATDGKEIPEQASNDEISSEVLQAPSPTIVMVRHYKEINSTPQGGVILGRLLDIIRRRRKEGQSIVLVGTASSADLMPSLSKSGIRNLQSEYEEGLLRTIVVTPPRTHSQDGVFAEDESRRIREINVRHLRDMIRRRSQGDEQSMSSSIQGDWRLDSSLEFTSGLSDSLWPFDRVHRIAVSTLGGKAEEGALMPEDVGRALETLDASDEAKFRWANEEKQKLIGEDSLNGPSVIASPPMEAEERMKRLRKTCNAHEKKLLSGVVNPENIHTTFKDVRALPETVEALKTLTSLSLIRPEAFSYGVLATDKIPGLLLYGPPGTGKTLLAKAVAKESGATVLEVSGAEVYDMYVGEGEKNVKAIFTLAKKLSPCVVFIDEADAILGARSSHTNRTSHRELINMFLQQWDGMNDLSAFIMVATNRPFDLDDAVLRRLPRRLLVDLPTEKDRVEILKIHLKDESLDPDVSLTDIAAQTNLYSGSDLKNISVAAALSCVREEVALSSTQPGYRPPSKRILAKRHFEKALDEISASISEDMSSLAAIKKFDEKYGDRKGKKKKSTAWGFGGVADAAQPLETGRVRN